MDLFWTIVFAIIVATFLLIIISWILGAIINGFLGNPVGKVAGAIAKD